DCMPPPPPRRRAPAPPPCVAVPRPPRRRRGRSPWLLVPGPERGAGLGPVRRRLCRLVSLVRLPVRLPRPAPRGLARPVRVAAGTVRRGRREGAGLVRLPGLGRVRVGGAA